MRQFLIFFILFSPFLHGEEIGKLWREVEVYAEAGEYEQAVVLGKRLLEQPLSLLQKRKLNYNLGTLLLLDKKWEEAITQFQLIPFEEELDPLLLKRLNHNIVTAYLLSVESILGDEDSEEKELKKGVDLLHVAMKHLQELEKSELKLSVFEKGEIEEKREQFQEFWDKVKLLLIKINERIDKNKIKNLSFKELLTQAKKGLMIYRLQLQRLGKWNLEEKEQLKNLYSLQKVEREGMVIWDLLREQVTKEEELKKTKGPFFTTAEKQFLTSLDWMKEGNLWEAFYSKGIACVFVQLLERLEEKQDPLFGLLKDRVELRLLLEQGELYPALKKGYKREESSYRDLAIEITKSLEKSWLEKQEDPASQEPKEEEKGEEKEKLDILGTIALLNSLSKELLLEKNKEGQWDSLLYTLALSGLVGKEESIFFEEIFILAHSYIRGLGLLEEGFPYWEKKVVENIRALKEKFLIKQQVHPEERKEDVKKVLELLENGLASVASIKKEETISYLMPFVEQAFLVWDPKKAAVATLKTLILEGEPLAKEKVLLKQRVLHWKEHQEGDQKVLEGLKKESKEELKVYQETKKEWDLAIDDVKQENLADSLEHLREALKKLEPEEPPKEEQDKDKENKEEDKQEKEKEKEEGEGGEDSQTPQDNNEEEQQKEEQQEQKEEEETPPSVEQALEMLQLMEKEDQIKGGHSISPKGGLRAW